jgi:Organic solute transport protein 1
LCAVLADVGRAMLNDKFIDELFKPQEMYAAPAIRQVFDKLAHSSIMRLNETSMDKVCLRRFPHR